MGHPSTPEHTAFLPPVVIICGPTGVGKTAAAITLARRYTGEIVGADSMQIYRFMDIGTAKPSPEERTQVPHHLIDFLPPDAPFDAAQYEKAAREVIETLHAREKLPIVAGGTGFYIKALTQGLFDALPSDPDVRERLKREAETLGGAALHQRLSENDPITAQKLHANDTYRVLRALEVFDTTGIPISQHRDGHQFRDRPFRMLKLGLTLPREMLYARLDQRVDAMIKAGLLDEVKMLLEKGYLATLKSMQSIGYRQMADYLEGRLSFEEALRIMKRDTRRYAKRQLTWFTADPETHWFAPDQLGDMETRVDEFLESS